MADWIKSSYMARSGVASPAGKTHELTVAKQGKYHMSTAMPTRC